MNFSGISFDSDSDMDDTEMDKALIGTKLAEWAIHNNISHIALGDLLVTLQPYHPSLSSDPRMLLKTPINYIIRDLVADTTILPFWYCPRD